MLNRLCVLAPIALVSIVMVGCSGTKPISSKNLNLNTDTDDVPVVYEKRSPNRFMSAANNSFNHKLSSAALSRLHSRVRYDGSYVKIAYPGGDVPQNIGVCTDVVIRSYRKLGIDLQEQVHRDMSAAFNSYPNPQKWGLSHPDTNIDHRRVYNLRQFFARRGAALPITHNPQDYKPGDLVTWMVGPDLPHIGVVVNKPTKADPKRLMIVHNIAHGPQMEDILFRFPITGHYRYTPAHMGNIPQGAYVSNQAAPKRHSMSYAQLVEAANLLGTGTSRRSVTSSAQPVTVATNASNDKLLDQVVTLNGAPGPAVKAKDNSFKIAKLSKEEIDALLAK